MKLFRKLFPSYKDIIIREYVRTMATEMKLVISCLSPQDGERKIRLLGKAYARNCLFIPTEIAQDFDKVYFPLIGRGIILENDLHELHSILKRLETYSKQY